MHKVLTNRVYRHFKGNFYYVHNIAFDSETKEPYVVYQMMYEPFDFYIRSVEMFTGKIDSNRKDNITGQSLRFELWEER